MGILWVALGVAGGFGGIMLSAAVRDRVAGVPRQLSAPPETIHPVDLAFLWSAARRHLSPRSAYRAGLLHLARTGAIEILPVGTVSDPEDFLVKLIHRPEDDFDADLIDFIFPDGGREATSLDDLRARGSGRA